MKIQERYSEDLTMNQPLKPEPFSGLPSQDPRSWLVNLKAWLSLNDWANDAAKTSNSLKLLLTLPASS